MTEGWYWYRSTAPNDPASSGDWVVLYVDGYGSVEVADMSFQLTDLKGEWSGPIVPPESSEDTRLVDMTCPNCQKRFVLSWDNYPEQETTLLIRSAPSAGIYGVSIECPWCRYREDVK